MLVKGAFEKARIYIESRKREPDEIRGKIKRGPCITISRETGAGAGRVSEELVKYFHPINEEYLHPWTVFDKNLIEKVIEDHHLPKELSRYFVEDKLSEIKSTVNELLGIHPSSWILVNKTANTILQLAQIGNVIIVGRGSNIITKHLSNVFHVRLIAPMETKINYVMDFYRKTKKESIDFIMKEDAARRNYVKQHFNTDVSDLKMYHLVLNTGMVSYEKAARIIGESAMELYPYLFPENIFTSKYDYA